MFIESIKRIRESDKMRGLLGIFLIFCNEFNKFNNTRARLLDSIYHIIKSHFWRGTVKILPYFTQRYNERHNVFQKSVNH